MAWQDALLKLREDLAEVRAERSRRAAEAEAEHQQRQQQLSELATSLELSGLLAKLNDILLDSQGEIETFSSWETPEEEEDADAEAADLALYDAEDEEEEADFFTAILSWEEDGEREIAVDLGLTDEGFSLRVNGVDTRLERDALEQSLVQAFRDELEI